jgi:methionine synthase I (cobalamin-dependent)
VPEDAALDEEHGELARHLATAGAEVLLVETMNTAREALAATRAALATGLPTLVSLVCAPSGTLLSGESLTAAAAAVAELGALAVGVNCVAAPDMAGCLALLPPGVAHLAYANIGHATPEGAWVATDAMDPATYRRYAAGWPVALIGGCCGTRPEHVAALAAVSRDQGDDGATTINPPGPKPPESVA